MGLEQPRWMQQTGKMRPTTRHHEGSKSALGISRRNGKPGRAPDETYANFPDNIDGMVGQMRESNKRTHGEQPLIPSNAWWQKTAGASRTSVGKTQEAGRGASGWKATKRELDWNDTLAHGNGKMPPAMLGGEDGVEEASLHRILAPSQTGKLDSDQRKPQPPEEVEGRPLNKPRTTIDRMSAEGVRRGGNPAAPGHPGDMQEFDLATLVGKLIDVMYADDAWVDAPKDTQECYRPSNTTLLNDGQKQVENRLVRKGAACGTSINTPIPQKRSVCEARNTTSEATLDSASGTLIEEDTTK